MLRPLDGDAASSYSRLPENIFTTLIAMIFVVMIMPVMAILFIYACMTMCSELVTTNSGKVIFFIGLILFSLLLFGYRVADRLLYGISEIAVGIIAAGVTVLNLDGGISPIDWVKIAGVAYLIVRGCDNVRTGTIDRERAKRIAAIQRIKQLRRQDETSVLIPNEQKIDDE